MSLPRCCILQYFKKCVLTSFETLDLRCLLLHSLYDEDGSPIRPAVRARGSVCVNMGKVLGIDWHLPHFSQETRWTTYCERRGPAFWQFWPSSPVNRGWSSAGPHKAGTQVCKIWRKFCCLLLERLFVDYEKKSTLDFHAVDFSICCDGCRWVL